MSEPIRIPLVLEPPRYSSFQSIVLRTGRYVIGSASECDLVIPGQGIVSNHAEIVCDEKNTRFIALDDRCWINDGPARETNLRPGDRVTLGPFTFRIRLARDEELPAVTPMSVKGLGSVSDQAMPVIEPLNSVETERTPTSESMAMAAIPEESILDDAAHLIVPAGSIPSEPIEPPPSLPEDDVRDLAELIPVISPVPSTGELGKPSDQEVDFDVEGQKEETDADDIVGLMEPVSLGPVDADPQEQSAANSARQTPLTTDAIRFMDQYDSGASGGVDPEALSSSEPSDSAFIPSELPDEIDEPAPILSAESEQSFVASTEENLGIQLEHGAVSTPVPRRPANIGPSTLSSVPESGLHKSGADLNDLNSRVSALREARESLEEMRRSVTAMLAEQRQQFQAEIDDWEKRRRQQEQSLQAKVDQFEQQRLDVRQDFEARTDQLRKDRESFDKQLSEVQAQRAAIHAERDQLSQTTDRLQEERRQFELRQAEFEQSQAQHVSLEQQVSLRDQELALLASRLDRRNLELNAREERLSKLEADAEQAGNQREELLATIAASERALQTLQQEMTALRASSRRQEEELEQEQSRSKGFKNTLELQKRECLALQEQVAQNRTMLADLRAQNLVIDEQYQALVAAQTDSRAERDRAIEERDNLVSSLNELKQSLAAQEAERSASSQEEIGFLQSQIADLMSQHEIVQSEKAALDARLTEQEERLHQVQLESERSRQRVADLNQALASSESALRTQEEQTENVRSQLDSARSDYESAVRRNEDLNQQLAQTVAEHSDSQSIQSQLTNEVHRAVEGLEAADRELNRIRTRVVELETQEHSQSSEIARLQSDLADERAHREMLDQQLQSAREELNRATVEFNQVRDSLIQEERHRNSDSVELARLRSQILSEKRHREQAEEQAAAMNRLKLEKDREGYDLERELQRQLGQNEALVAELQNAQTELEGFKSRQRDLETELSRVRESLAASPSVSIPTETTRNTPRVSFDSDATGGKVSDDGGASDPNSNPQTPFPKGYGLPSPEMQYFPSLEESDTSDETASESDERFATLDHGELDSAETLGGVDTAAELEMSPITEAQVAVLERDQSASGLDGDTTETRSPEGLHHVGPHFHAEESSPTLDAGPHEENSIWESETASAEASMQPSLANLDAIAAMIRDLEQTSDQEVPPVAQHIADLETSTDGPQPVEDLAVPGVNDEASADTKVVTALASTDAIATDVLPSDFVPVEDVLTEDLVIDEHRDLAPAVELAEPNSTEFAPDADQVAGVMPLPINDDAETQNTSKPTFSYRQSAIDLGEDESGSTENDDNGQLDKLRAELSRMFDLPSLSGGTDEENTEEEPAQSFRDEIEQAARSASMEERPTGSFLGSLIRKNNDAEEANAEPLDEQPESETAESVSEPELPAFSFLRSSPPSFEQPSPAEEQPLAEEKPIHQEDDSIAAYMERLLARNRLSGSEDGSGFTMPSSAPVAAPVAAIAPSAPLDLSQPIVTELGEFDLTDRSYLEAAPRHQANKDEVREALQSFRRVANDSARSAVSKYLWKTTRGSTVIKAGLTAASFMAAGTLAEGSLYGVRNLTGAVGCLIGGVFLAVETVRSVRVLLNPVKATKNSTRESDV